MLSFTKTILLVAEISSPVPIHPKFALPNYSTLSFFCVYGLKFTNFSTLIKHLRDCLSWKFDGVGGGCSRKCLENRKNRQILSQLEFEYFWTGKPISGSCNKHI